MKRLFKISVLILIGLTLVSCSFGDLTNNQQNENEPVVIPKITELVYVGQTDNKKEYLLYYSDGTSEIIYITDDSPLKNEITIDDLYQRAVLEGFTGSMSDFIKDYVNISINSEKAAINKGLKSSVSIFAHFVKEEERNPIFGIPEIIEVEYTSAGSGVIYKINKDLGTAYIITNHHVIYDKDSNRNNKISNDIDIYLYGLELPGFEIKGTYIGGSEMHDVAVIKVENSEILKNSIAEAAIFADSELVEPGDDAIAIGNAEARGISVTKGIVSVDSENINMTTNDLGVVSFRVMRIDTAVNKGNSGGGLFNLGGEVIGIVNAKMISNDIDSIGYALPANTVSNLADSIIYYCDNKTQEKAEKVLIGVTMKVNSRIVSYDEENDKIKYKDIINVDAINPDSLGSLHFELDDEIANVIIKGVTYEITRLHQLGDLLFKVRRNETIIFTVIRGGVETLLEITFTNDNFNIIN